MLPPSPFDPGCHIHMLCIYEVTFHCQKGILGQGGKASSYKLKDTNFNSPMTNVLFFSIFRMHGQKEDSTLLDLKSTSVLNIKGLFVFKNSSAFTQSFDKTVPSLKTKSEGWGRKSIFSQLVNAVLL